MAELNLMLPVVNPDGEVNCIKVTDAELTVPLAEGGGMAYGVRMTPVWYGNDGIGSYNVTKFQLFKHPCGQVRMAPAHKRRSRHKLADACAEAIRQVLAQKGPVWDEACRVAAPWGGVRPTLEWEGDQTKKATEPAAV